MVSGYQKNSVFAVSMTTKLWCTACCNITKCINLLQLLYWRTPCNSFLIIKILFWRSVHRCYTDNNTERLEGWYLVMCMVNLLPSLSLKVHSYPECIREVSTRYKSTAAESRMRSRQLDLHHCSIVYTVGKTTWSVYGSIVMRYAVPTPFKHNLILTG